MTRNRTVWFKNLLIRGFLRLYPVDVAEAAAAVPEGYESFNAFFTRTLKPGLRPLDADPAAIPSPADGRIQQIGAIRDQQILQVKGMDYRLDELLGGDAEAAAAYRNGSFATIYLAPSDYHRVHSPFGGEITAMTYVAGELWSVNARTAARIPRLFARNERIVCHGRASWGRFAVILVGALNVGSVSTTWAGEVLPRRGGSQHWDYGNKEIRVERGGPLGQFNMGSTVILLLPAGLARWNDTLRPGDPLRMGQTLGMRQTPS